MHDIYDDSPYESLNKKQYQKLLTTSTLGLNKMNKGKNNALNPIPWQL